MARPRWRPVHPDAYVHADMSIKERALALTTPAGAQAPGRYRPTDKKCSPFLRACNYADHSQLADMPEARPHQDTSQSDRQPISA